MGTIATTSQKRLQSFKFTAACARGLVVKPGADAEHVTKSVLAVSKAIGICQNDITTAEEEGEVALPGGGAVGKLGASVAFGDELVCDTAGKLIPAANAGERVIAIAFQDGVADDLIAVEVVCHKAVSAQS